MKKKIAIFIVISLFIRIFFWPIRVVDIVKRNLETEHPTIEQFFVISPGFGSLKEYEISDNDESILLKELEDMRIIRFPLAKYLAGATTEDGYLINLASDRKRQITIHIFNKRFQIGKDYYIIVKPIDNYFNKIKKEK